MSKKVLILVAAGSLAIGGAIGYYFGYDHGFERATSILERTSK